MKLMRCGHIDQKFRNSVLLFCKTLYLHRSVSFKGQHLGTAEATEAFFAMTKLFQSKDVSYL